jgi:predicted lipoprotein with Yx(FWY)xxD motif
MRPRSVTARRLMTPALALAAAVLLAACGSSSNSTSSGKTTTTTAADAAGSTKTVVVKTASDPSLGTILVDADGKTLYTLTNGNVAVACTGGCLAAWPPALLPAGTTTASGSGGVTQLGTTPSGSDLQVTHDGLPLYRFAADTAAGDANGEGISSFGGTWHVVKLGGAASGSSTSTTKKSSSGY